MNSALLRRRPARKRPSRCAKKEWRRFDYGHAFSVLRKRFEELVGWYRRPQDPILNSDGAWQVVFARIFDEIYGP